VGGTRIRIGCSGEPSRASACSGAPAWHRNLSGSSEHHPASSGPSRSGQLGRRPTSAGGSGRSPGRPTSEAYALGACVVQHIADTVESEPGWVLCLVDRQPPLALAEPVRQAVMEAGRRAPGGEAIPAVGHPAVSGEQPVVLGADTEFVNLGRRQLGPGPAGPLRKWPVAVGAAGSPESRPDSCSPRLDGEPARSAVASAGLGELALGRQRRFGNHPATPPRADVGPPVQRARRRGDTAVPAPRR
jgi:hypothetical protein